MISNVRIEVATEEDMPRCMDLYISVFADIPMQNVLTGPNTPENRIQNVKHHLEAYREHAEKFPAVPVGIKCVYTDPGTGAETIIAFAEWFVWDRIRTPEEYERNGFLFRFDWLDDEPERQQLCREYLKSTLDARRHIMGGRPFGLLVNLCVDPEFRRLGAASECVKWGMEKCAELRIPTYLEATEDGIRVYEKLGWERLEDVKLPFPVMMWWPGGVKRE